MASVKASSFEPVDQSSEIAPAGAAIMVLMQMARMLRRSKMFRIGVPSLWFRFHVWGANWPALPGFVWLDSSMPRDPRRVEIEPAAVEVDRLA
ncbi:MAG: hypothetical protein ABL977_03685, partial [Candidatus Eisenbacteria bacterium]